MKIKPDNQGRVTCPECNTKYVPVLGLLGAWESIRHIYPESKPWQREQLLTGICSDRCWDRHLGVTGGSYDDNGECIAGTWRFEE